MTPARLLDSVAAACASAELRDGSRSAISAVRCRNFGLPSREGVLSAAAPAGGLCERTTAWRSAASSTKLARGRSSQASRLRPMQLRQRDNVGKSTDTTD